MSPLALGMMANWDLAPLYRDLRRFHLPLVLMTGSNDRTIPPRDAVSIRARVPSATIVPLQGLGHLAHEEQPLRIAELISQFARSWRVIEA